jgi:hypothetical protein
MTGTDSLPQFVSMTLLLIGVMLSLKRAAEMNRFFGLRVAVFTSILACLVLYFFLQFGFTFGNPPIEFDCDPTGQHFCTTEM